MSIIIENITFSYNHEKRSHTPIFENFSFHLESGKISAIVGPSGSGKSTLLKLICGLLSPSDGYIEINGSTVEHAQRAGMFGLVFQNADLLPWRSLLRNVLLPVELQKKKIDKNRALFLIRELGLAGWEDKHPYQLSGGMQQRTAIARALITEPPILLLDEPFSQLDELLRVELLLYIQDFSKRNHSTVIFITHNVTEAVLVSDIVYSLSFPPISKIDKTVIDLERPRTFHTTNRHEFHQLLAKVRGTLLKPNQLY